GRHRPCHRGHAFPLAGRQRPAAPEAPRRAAPRHPHRLASLGPRRLETRRRAPGRAAYDLPVARPPAVRTASRRPLTRPSTIGSLVRRGLAPAAAMLLGYNDSTRTYDTRLMLRTLFRSFLCVCAASVLLGCQTT